MRRTEETPIAPNRSRPSPGRAAAAARLAGAADSAAAVSERMRRAAERSSQQRSGIAGTVGSTALAFVPLRRSYPAGPQPAQPRHLRVVRDRGLSVAQRRRRARAALIASIAGATVIALTLVYLHVVLAQRQFALDRLNTQLAQAQATYQERRLQVAQLSSPQHVISEAEGQLGMTQPAKVIYLTPPPGTGTTPSAGTVAPLGERNAPPTVAPSGAPSGDADWPEIKSQLAGEP